MPSKDDKYGFHDKIPPKELLLWLKDHNGASIAEIKSHFLCTSEQVRRALGPLMTHNKVQVLPLGRGTSWMLIDGKRGRPSPVKVRAAWAEERNEQKANNKERWKERNQKLRVEYEEKYGHAEGEWVRVPSDYDKPPPISKEVAEEIDYGD